MPTRTEKTKILHYTASWLPQTMTWLYAHVTYLPDHLESHVVCQQTENLDQFPLANLTSLNARPSHSSLLNKVRRRLGLADGEKKSLALLEKVMDSIEPQVLHSHFGHFGWAASQAAYDRGIRQVVSFYGVDLSYLPRSDPRWKTRYREMSDRIDAVLCEGPHMARCIAELGVDEAKIQIFRLGIDLERFPYRPRLNSGKPKRFLIAGSFREKKGIPYALEALGRLAPSRPDMSITVIGDSLGSSREEAEKQKIMKAVEQYHLGPRTRFLGYQPYDRVIREFYEHDIFVSPSVTSSDGDTEGGAPVTVIEAAASGMPVASTVHCDIPFVLSGENRAYLAAERDAAGLAQVIETLLERRDWEPIVKANRRLVERELDLRRQTDKLAALYLGLGGRGSLPQANWRAASPAH